MIKFRQLCGECSSKEWVSQRLNYGSGDPDEDMYLVLQLMDT
jgi:hypothetical protein